MVLIGSSHGLRVPLLHAGVAGVSQRALGTLLVVEDDPVFRRLILAALGAAGLGGAHVATASSLGEAKTVLAKATPDCALLDLGLPDSDGLATVQGLLAVAPDLPVVVLTGEEDGGLANQALQAGAQDFLEKAQLEPGSLARAIRHALDRGRWAAQLSAKNRELEDRNRDLDDFAHAVSHDLKAPLRALFNLVVDAREQLAEGDQAAALQTLAGMEPRIRRLFDMIDGVLRLTTAARQSNAAPVDVAGVVREVVDSLQMPEGFTVEVDRDLPVVIGERTALAQVFQNLIDNAVKHHPRPTGRVQVTWRELPDAIEYSVCDDGDGIPADQRERVFQLFQTLSGRPGSTGIGLALVRKVVQSAGGTVAIEDNQPRGACFRVRLPRTRA